MKTLAKRTAGLLPVASGFCPGCTHSTLIKIIGESLEELGLLGKTITVLPIGCADLSAGCVSTDVIMSPHGRAPAVATGIKRCRPDRIVYTYQGDGDLTSIGLSEIMMAANRGEHFTTFFINNGIYGMTGGQMAPTTPIGEASTTGGKHRDPTSTGYPMKMCELLNQLDAPVYIARCALDSVTNIRKAKASIKKALQYQVDGKGYCFIEFLSACPTNWKMTPLKALEHVKQVSETTYPLGVFRDNGGENA